MNKSSITLLILAGLIVVIIGFSMSADRNPSTLTIGLIGPLSGDGTGFGETERHATEIALEEINALGGVGGRLVAVVYEDGRCNAKDALGAMQKLIAQNHVRIVLGGVCSAETLAIAPIANENKVLLFSAFSSSPDITNAGDYVFRNAPSDSDVAKLDGENLAKTGTRIALLTEETAYSLGVRTIILKTIAQHNLLPVIEERYASPLSGATNADYRAVLSKIKAVNPDVLYVNPGTSARAGGLIVKQARELGLVVPIHGNFSIATPEATVAAGATLEGAVVSDASDLSGKGKDLLARYKQRFGTEPTNAYEMGAAYDRVYILKQAIETVGDDPTKIREYLYSMPDFEGTVGRYHFDKNGDVVGVGFAEYVIKDGKKVPLTQ